MRTEVVEHEQVRLAQGIEYLVVGCSLVRTVGASKMIELVRHYGEVHAVTLSDPLPRDRRG